MPIEIFVHDDAVEVTLRGMDVVWCMARRIHIPIEAITTAQVLDVADVRPDLGWRVGGAYFPGLVTAGWFSVKTKPGYRHFWAMYRQREALVIDTVLKRPARLVIQHDDRDRLAWLIAERIPGTHPV
jgi:hypothetical protein